MRDCANPSNSNRENACWSSQAHIFKNTTGARLHMCDDTLAVLIVLILLTEVGRLRSGVTGEVSSSTPAGQLYRVQELQQVP